MNVADSTGTVNVLLGEEQILLQKEIDLIMELT